MIGGTTAVNAGWAPTQLEVRHVPYIVSIVDRNMKFGHDIWDNSVNFSIMLLLFITPACDIIGHSWVAFI